MESFYQAEGRLDASLVGSICDLAAPQHALIPHLLPQD